MREADPIGVRRRMHGITARLPKRASMGDDVAFVVNAPRHIFLDTRQLASWSWRPLRSRLAVNPFEIVDLALQALDPGVKLPLLDLSPALGFGELGEARFVSFFEFTNMFCELAKTRVEVGNLLEIVELTL